MQLSTTKTDCSVVALYRFFPVGDPDGLRAALTELCDQNGIRGTLIIAGEGINGTVAGDQRGIDALVAYLEQLDGFSGAEIKYSTAEEMPFRRLKIRIKNEIVTMGVPDVDPSRDRGHYVDARAWNNLISDPDTLLIDTRNDYEAAIGTFEGAVDPHTATFREFPAWVEENRALLEGRKVAMFCTGGIRCEKATAYVKSLGIEDVFHLKGGILKYLEDVDAGESRWNGECFVFDERVAVGHGLVEGDLTLCRACRHPLKPEERKSPEFIEGVSCPHCHDKRSDADRERYAQRQRQVDRALARGEAHPIGRVQLKRSAS